jgi:hypothetical protein
MAWDLLRSTVADQPMARDLSSVVICSGNEKLCFSMFPCHNVMHDPSPSRMMDVDCSYRLTILRFSEHDPICHLFELILVIHANTSNGTNHNV